MKRSPEQFALPSIAFDKSCTSETTPKDVGERVKYLEKELFNKPHSLRERAVGITAFEPDSRKKEAKKLFDDIQDVCVGLFLQWNLSRTEKDKATEFAVARLFNGLTHTAREVDKRYNFIDKSHLQSLGEAITDDLDSDDKKSISDSEYVYDPRQLARAVDKAAKEHLYEKAWLFVALPTFSRQHYGRVLLDTVTSDSQQKALIVQSSFTDGKATLFHTHGQNWAFSRPLGEDKKKNRHLNIICEPEGQRDGSQEVFPLRLRETQLYQADNVIVIPPKTIHAISGRRDPLPEMAVEQYVRLSESTRKALAKNVRVGEFSSLHVYKSDARLVREFGEDNPVVLEGKAESNFFETNDMIVFDQKEKSIWAGGGGAWPLRLMQSGEHCGLCFIEDDPRRNEIDHTVVYRRFIQNPPQNVIIYQGPDLNE